MNTEWNRRAQAVKLLILDVDGVLTTGHIVFGPTGEAVKFFHAQDGLGISLAHQAGLKTAIITGRTSDIVGLRAAELHISDICQGVADKAEAFSALLTKYKLPPEHTAYIGDDLNDLPVMLRVGLACAPVNAVPEVKERAHIVSTQAGGQGAVREIVELILKAQGQWEDLVRGYLQSACRNLQQ